MPPPSTISHLPPSHPAQRQRPKSPNRVLAEAEAQWLFTEAELANTPSIQDGMSQTEERETRAKGVNFIVQVGIMLKLPQLTLSTAAVFFQRFLMRASLKKERNGIPKLHHFQSAATALFLATKVEESCRKMKELILAFCRVAQKNPNLIIDEQSKDFWRWRDCVLHNEDVLLDTLCFDLTIESPHRQLFDLLKWYGVEHNKPLRNRAWAFVTDSDNTQLCLLCSSRTIAVASLYAACRYCEVALPDDAKGRPWWETQHVRLKDVRRALEHMCASYEQSAGKTNGTATSEGERSIYHGLSTPMESATDGWDSTRMKPESYASPLAPVESHRRTSNASSVGVKREREEQPLAMNGERHEHANRGDVETNGHKRARLSEENSTNPKRELKLEADSKVKTEEASGEMDSAKRREEALRIENGNKQAEADVKAADEVVVDAGAKSKGRHEEGSEEGEVEE